jgi:hypothetical protein
VKRWRHAERLRVELWNGGHHPPCWPPQRSGSRGWAMRCTHWMSCISQHKASRSIAASHLHARCSPCWALNARQDCCVLLHRASWCLLAGCGPAAAKLPVPKFIHRHRLACGSRWAAALPPSPCTAHSTSARWLGRRGTCGSGRGSKGAQQVRGQNCWQQQLLRSVCLRAFQPRNGQANRQLDCPGTTHHCGHTPSGSIAAPL